MLIDKNGKRFDEKKLPKDRSARAAVLATLTEVQSTRPSKGPMFNLEARARLGQGR